MSATSEPAVTELKRRIETAYVTKWCSARGMDAKAFRPEYSFLTPEIAEWFLRGVDEEVVVAAARGGFQLPDGSKSGMFEHGPRKAMPQATRLYAEGLIEVAAVAKLHLRDHWRTEYLSFQSPRYAQFPRYKESRQGPSIFSPTPPAREQQGGSSSLARRRLSRLRCS